MALVQMEKSVPDPETIRINTPRMSIPGREDTKEGNNEKCS